MISTFQAWYRSSFPPGACESIRIQRDFRLILLFMSLALGLYGWLLSRDFGWSKSSQFYDNISRRLVVIGRSVPTSRFRPSWVRHQWVWLYQLRQQLACLGLASYMCVFLPDYLVLSTSSYRRRQLQPQQGTNEWEEAGRRPRAVARHPVTGDYTSSSNARRWWATLQGNQRTPGQGSSTPRRAAPPTPPPPPYAPRLASRRREDSAQRQ